MTRKRRPPQSYNPELHGRSRREATGRPSVSLVLTTEARNALRAMAAESGESMSAIVVRLVLAARRTP